MPSPGDLNPGDPASDIATVEAMLEALTRGGLQTAGALLAPDVIWRNTGLPAVRGRHVLRVLGGIDRLRLSFSVVTHHRAAADGVVLNDRTDVLGIGPLRSVFPVRGTFVVRDGRIALWDDQFSLRQFLIGFFRRRPSG
ncbi:limonene-1,2-epoxide hydrolase family protein [Nocardioides gilvus]|uniref:limonene-1,2-epoxide hydrolase family protein n=1 Tax=Nocardioides gilvus TaxID=1735589 RepID=UPI000D7421DA|nr:limonene-1,2-epoxide hydrolase family protein [Nocardioides gilvus]